ncbi:hypothetical protein [Sphingobacterium hotanense]|uniref:hypothetical protein n=1 Tax=Sphingobacterium hotanense TaxID=649196 RepID=UPI0021A744FE|nr:hypothetical protein [Sphingobacterium hotanense]MCT1525090.1 hypothetical protein [Sphingobacterium hotanense]
MEKVLDIAHFIRYLKGSSLYVHLNRHGLVEQMSVGYLARGSHCRFEEPMLVMVTSGLLKQYNRFPISKTLSRFIQFLTPGMFCPSDGSPFYPLVRALEPTYLFYVPFRLVFPLIAKNRQFAFDLAVAMELDYGSGLSFSHYLRCIKEPSLCMDLFLERYGNNVDYLSNREIASYIGASESTTRQLLYFHYNKLL